MNMKEITKKLNSGDWEPLYFATEKQIITLIDQNKIDGDFYSRYQVYQQEMSYLLDEVLEEFS
tara:strand:- start:301 stop:489 length:189 start_codon:yes stop_codon:yes gene_type:complete